MMVELFETELRQEAGSSKGNQLKWFSGNFWYKADYTGYEGLSEYVCSAVLGTGTLGTTEYVKYETEQIKYKTRTINGCKSRNFLPAGWQLFTLERLVKLKTGESIGASLFRLENFSDRLKFLETQAVKATGIADFGLYLSKMITLDSVFLNEDRHTHNIAVLESPDGNFHLCPFFDQGGALLSDTTLDYPLGDDVYNLMKAVKSKTFCDRFDDALETAEKLYGVNLKFNYNYNSICDIVAKDRFYSEEIKNRIKTILLEQKRRYGYLFI